MVDQIRFFATAARHLEGKSAGEYMRNMTSFIRREPIGVCAQVAPWNYPMLMAVWKFGPALAAGNAVVLKPSDTTPASTTLLAEIAAEFFPPGVFNVVCGDRDTGRAMVLHDMPAMVSVTGSVRAGQEVAAAAAQSAEALPPRARRQGAGRGVRRRRHRRGGGGDCDRRIFQCRSGLHCGHPCAGRAAGLRRLRRRTRRAGQGHPDRHARQRGCAVRPGQQLQSTRPRRRHGRAEHPITPTSPPADTRWLARASSSSRPSSVGCIRTTR